jgi:hypothetical protein
VDDFRDRLVPSSQWINEAGLGTLARNLTTIVAVARAHGIVPLLSTFAVRDTAGAGSDGLGPAMKRANDLLRELAAQLEVPIVPAAERLQDKPDLYKDWMHFNDQGERRHAEVVLACLAQQKLFGLGGRPSPPRRRRRAPSVRKTRKRRDVPRPRRAARAERRAAAPRASVGDAQ